MSKRQKITIIGRSVEKWEALYVVGGDVKGCLHHGKEYGESLGKLKRELHTTHKFHFRGFARIERHAGTHCNQIAKNCDV